MRYAQVLVLSIGMIMLFISIYKYFRNRKLIDLIIWVPVWVLFIFAIIFFEQIRFVGEIMFNLEVMDFFLLFAVIIMFLIIYTNYNNNKETQDKLNKLIEHISVKEGIKKIDGDKK